jgi:hypothetical protein
VIASSAAPTFSQQFQLLGGPRGSEYPFDVVTHTATFVRAKLSERRIDGNVNTALVGLRWSQWPIDSASVQRIKVSFGAYTILDYTLNDRETRDIFFDFKEPICVASAPAQDLVVDIYGMGINTSALPIVAVLRGYSIARLSSDKYPFEFDYALHSSADGTPYGVATYEHGRMRITSAT